MSPHRQGNHYNFGQKKNGMVAITPVISLADPQFIDVV